MLHNKLDVNFAANTVWNSNVLDVFSCAKYKCDVINLEKSVCSVLLEVLY